MAQRRSLAGKDLVVASLAAITASSIEGEVVASMPHASVPPHRGLLSCRLSTLLMQSLASSAAISRLSVVCGSGAHRPPLAHFLAWDNLCKPDMRVVCRHLHSRAPSLPTHTSQRLTTLQVNLALVLNEVCPTARLPLRATKLIAKNHQLHTKPISAVARVVVGPNCISTGRTVVFEQVRLAGIKQSHRKGTAWSKLCSQDLQHRNPIGTMTMVASIWRLGCF
mmetsp:Transcript_43168/g.99493  ORF Transcript_43168/g.99493 Transcript_43168/m.99493 type:complete len:223 (+) Transcript_43168:468-1136(+)